MTTAIIESVGNNTSTSGNEYASVEVSINGQTARAFGDWGDFDHLNVGDKIEVLNLKQKGKYMNFDVGEVIETAEEIQARIGDLDDLLAAEYAKSYAAAERAMPSHAPAEAIQACASSVFIQKSRMKSFVE